MAHLLTASCHVEGALIILQLMMYLNTYYVLVYLLGPLGFMPVLLLTAMHSRSLWSFYNANQTHKNVVVPDAETDQYCRRCRTNIHKRDHHCIFLGRCV